MPDAQFMREHLEEVEASCRNRNVKAGVDGWHVTQKMNSHTAKGGHYPQVTR
jgi:hypothetical protein